MIGLDSPIASILGEARGGKGQARNTRIVEGLQIHTVGDLLLHFPRRYLETGELSRVEDLEPNQMLTLVGRIARVQVHTYDDRRTGRPAYRLEAVLETDGPSLRMTFFAKNKGISGYQARRLSVGTTGMFAGKVSRFREHWQLTNPQMVLFGRPGDGEDGDLGPGAEDVAPADDLLGPTASVKALFPVYPLTKGVESWDLQRAVAFALSVLDELDDVLPETVRATYHLMDRRRALEGVHAPDDYAQVGAAQRRSASRRPWSPSWCWDAVGAAAAQGARRAATGAPAGCSPPSTPGCRSG